MNNRLLQHGQHDDGGPRDVEERLQHLHDEWTISPYHRDLALAVAVNGSMATATYGNRVAVVALPIADHTSPAELPLEPLGMGHGERVGSAGFPIRPLEAAEHRSVNARVQARHGGHYDSHTP